MVFYDRYEIELKVDNTLVDVPAANYTFTIKDSIYELYPRVIMSFDDSSGLYNEYLAFVNGTKFDIKFGNKDDFITCPFIINKNSIPQQRTQISFGGATEIELVHEYYYYQKKQALAFNDEISNIIRRKISTFPFHNASTLDIDTTYNKGYWYQPLITDAEFISNMLLPFAFSSNSLQSPFYFFIDINNDIHFSSLKSLFIDKKESIELIHKQGLETDALALNRILYINTYQSAMRDIKGTYNRLVTKFDKDGNLEDEQDSLVDYPNLPNSGLVPLRFDSSLLTGNIELLDEDINNTSSLEKNDNMGIKIFAMRDSILLDKVLITCNLNTNLRAGKKIKASIYNKENSDKTDLSYRYSGEYLIETSYHKWFGRTASTVLVCGRQSITIPSNYKNAKTISSK